MINDPAVRDEIAREWSVLTSTARRTGFMVPRGAYVILGDEGCHLGLVLAFCSLEDVLKQFTAQGDIPQPDRDFLSNRMDASRKPASKIRWVNFDLVVEGRRARNKLAHEGITPSREDCLKYIDAIAVEFQAWKIIT